MIGAAYLMLSNTMRVPGLAVVQQVCSLSFVKSCAMRYNVCGSVVQAVLNKPFYEPFHGTYRAPACSIQHVDVPIGVCLNCILS